MRLQHNAATDTTTTAIDDRIGNRADSRNDMFQTTKAPTAAQSVIIQQAYVIVSAVT